MINETVTIGLLLLLVIGLAGKKKPVFGQLTLTGELALDWLKDGSEIIAGKIMIGPCGAFPEYNVPDWASERNDMIAVIEHANVHQNPLLVTQKSVMKAIELECVGWEEAGADCRTERSGSATRAVIEFPESQPKMRFERSKVGGKFAPYLMHVEE
tara:strand:+ start:300 stop:767 length:468 start_codon:yes stop_codon:yes gene_type:complete